MSKVLTIALLFFSCQQQAMQKKSPYDFASQQQLSYVSKLMTFKDSMKLPGGNAATQVNTNYQKWAIQYWKDNPKIEQWLLQVKDMNSNDTAAFFTLTDYNAPIALVSNAKTNSAIYNAIQSIHENAYVIATGKVESSPSFEHINDTTLQRVYLNAAFDTIIEVTDSVQ